MHRGLLYLPLLAALLWGCFSGGATETETGTANLTGEVKRPDGLPAVGALVRLRPDDFAAGDNPEPGSGGRVLGDTVTDSKGRFAFNRVEPGEYQVEALYSEEYGAVSRFKVGAGSKRFELEDLTLQSLLTLTGQVRFSDSSLGPATVHVLGTEHLAIADSATGRFELRGIPPGIFDLSVSTPVPFFPAKEFPGLVVDGPVSVDVGELVLDKGTKQAFTMAGGQVAFAGIDGSNPVIYDNDFGSNTWDNEFLWALASLGRVELRGNLVTLLGRDSLEAMPTEFSKLIREAQICRLSGIRNIPEPVLGASRKLALPPGGRWQDIRPESNPGIRLLVDEARKATLAKPLIVVAEGELTTVANAVLLDPYIVDRIVVMGIYNHALNGKDSLASFLVARKCRFVAWGRDYFWAGPGPSAAPLPGNWLGSRLKTARESATSPQIFFADYAALPFLVDGRAWRSARGAQALSPPLNTSLSASAPFDFVDIPQDANDWALMDQVFFATLADSGAYHPWAVPGTVEGISFKAMSGAAVDSIAGEGDVVAGIGPEDWVEYSLDAAVDGSYDLILRNRCTAQATLEITGREAASRVDLELQAGTGWVETRTRVHLGMGPQTIRITTKGGAWELGRLRLEAAP